MKQSENTNCKLSIQKKKMSFYLRANIILIIMFIFSIAYSLIVIFGFDIITIPYGKILAIIPSLILNLFFAIIFFRYKLSYLLYLPILAQLAYIIGFCGVLLTL